METYAVEEESRSVKKRTPLDSGAEEERVVNELCEMVMVALLGL